MQKTFRYLPSTVNTGTSNSKFSFGADLNQEPVFLDGKILDSVSFARAMLVLSKIVKLNSEVKIDRSRYQKWVNGQYVKELLEKVGKINLGNIFNLRNREQNLLKNLAEVNESLKSPYRKLDEINSKILPKRRLFWNWLYTHNRDAWIILDPIVSVQPDATFFEAFSKDESTYAVVKLPHELLDHENDFQIGTTNIDFSENLEKEFARTRSYRGMEISVGSKSVGIATSDSFVVERKIDLPDTWVRGLVEVQGASAISSIDFKISSETLARVILKLESIKEKNGPRFLKFVLEPGKNISIVMEPWGKVIEDSRFIYSGKTPHEIKIWGRRRLMVLKDLLPWVDEISVSLLDSGMPSFWRIEINKVQLELGLSGWSNLDWAGKARFSSFASGATAKKETVLQAAEILKKRLTLTADELALELNIKKSESLAALKGLSLIGKSMYDKQINAFRWRELFPEFNYDLDDKNREEKVGIELFEKKKVSKTKEFVDKGNFYFFGNLPEENIEPKLGKDIDGRIVYAECNCSFFRYNKLKFGPCRHIVALSLMVG